MRYEYAWYDLHTSTPDELSEGIEAHRGYDWEVLSVQAVMLNIHRVYYRRLVTEPD